MNFLDFIILDSVLYVKSKITLFVILLLRSYRTDGLTITEKNSKILKLPRKNVSKPKVLFTKIVEGKKRYYENKAKTLVKEEYRLDVRNVFSLSGDDCPGR